MNSFVSTAANMATKPVPIEISINVSVLLYITSSYYSLHEIWFRQRFATDRFVLRCWTGTEGDFRSSLSKDSSKHSHFRLTAPLPAPTTVLYCTVPNNRTTGRFPTKRVGFDFCSKSRFFFFGMNGFFDSIPYLWQVL